MTRNIALFYFLVFLLQLIYANLSVGTSKWFNLFINCCTDTDHIFESIFMSNKCVFLVKYAMERIWRKNTYSVHYGCPHLNDVINVPYSWIFVHKLSCKTYLDKLNLNLKWQILEILFITSKRSKFKEFLRMQSKWV